MSITALSVNESPRCVAITGASRRLGLFLTQHLLAAGWQVLAITRGPSQALTAMEQNPQLHIIRIADYGADSIAEAITQISATSQSLHALIHNASAFEKDGTEFSMQAYQGFFEVHMAAPAQLNMGLLPLLYNRKTPGNIIHITDIFADNPNAEFSLYCSTKAGLENLTKGFAKKFAPGVRVNSIAPGPIQFLPSHSEQAKQAVLKQTLLPEEGGFEPIFQAVAAILENSYMTGASIKVDGGRSLGRD